MKVKKLAATGDCEQLLTLGQVCTHDNVMQGSFLMNIDTRVVASRILAQDTLLKVFANLPLVEEHVKYLDAKVDICKSYWKTMHKQYLTIMNLLKSAQIKQ